MYRKYGFFDQENPSYFQTLFEILGDAREEHNYLQKYERKEEYKQYTKELPQRVQKKGLAKKLQITDPYGIDLVERLMAYKPD